jgi:hypothetical protein
MLRARGVLLLAEMHAAAPKDLPGRYQLPEMPRCTGCHPDLEHGSVRDHAIHVGKVQCQACHSPTYVSCWGCHVGKDGEGTAFFQNRLEVEGMKIGLAADPEARWASPASSSSTRGAATPTRRGTLPAPSPSTRWRAGCAPGPTPRSPSR